MSAISQFRSALLDAAQDAPRGVLDGNGKPANARYDVYRNNVVVALQDALRANFPILNKLLGPDVFEPLADVYLHKHLPRTAMMMFYGNHMPDLIANLAPLKDIGYLADVAELELALRRSYHAADADPIDPTSLALDDAALAQVTLTFAPATALIQSDWPLFDIWRFNTQNDAPAPQAIAQSILITRTQFDPEPHALTPAEYAWAVTVQNGETLGTAHANALQIDAAFDLTPLLLLLLRTNALTTPPTKGRRR